MGVLARLFRRSQTTEEATTETATDEAATETAAEAAAEAVAQAATEEVTTTPEAPAGTPEDGAEAVRPSQALPATEPDAGGAGAGETTESGTEAEAAGDAAVAATDGVEIPRQQSAEEVADSEAGEGART